MFVKAGWVYSSWYSLGAPWAHRNSLRRRKKDIVWKSLRDFMMNGVSWEVRNQKPEEPAAPWVFGLETSIWTPFTMIPPRLFHTLSKYMKIVNLPFLSKEQCATEEQMYLTKIYPNFIQSRHKNYKYSALCIYWTQQIDQNSTVKQ